MGRDRVLLRSLGEKIKNLRKRENLTQEEFAVNLNISLDSVKNWEQGYNYPSVDMLVTIAEYFKCDFDYLLGQQDSPNKVYKHISEYTGLSEESIDNLIYFHKEGSVFSDFLEDFNLLFSIDELINLDYSKLNLTIAHDFFTNKIEFDANTLYRADKLDLYDHICTFINSSRKKRGLNPI